MENSPTHRRHLKAVDDSPVTPTDINPNQDLPDITQLREYYNGEIPISVLAGYLAILKGQQD